MKAVESLRVTMSFVSAALDRLIHHQSALVDVSPAPPLVMLVSELHEQRKLTRCCVVAVHVHGHHCVAVNVVVFSKWE
jgi:hypothetical protein